MKGNEIRILQTAESVRVMEAYTFFLENLSAGQKINIPYRAIRSCKNDPIWTTKKLKHRIGLKRNIKRLRQVRRTIGNSVSN